MPTSYEGVDGSVPTVLLVDLRVPLATHVEEHAANRPGQNNNANNATSRDASHVDTSGIVFVICSIGFSKLSAMYATEGKGDAGLPLDPDSEADGSECGTSNSRPELKTE